MATINAVSAKVLIQIGDNEPIEVGTLDIPITLTLGPDKKPGPVYRGVVTPEQIANESRRS